MSHIRVLLADDHRLFREGLRQICEIVGGFEVIGEAENGQEAIYLAQQLEPDIVLMDIQMPGLDGVQATNSITERVPATRVIILTMYRQDHYVFEAIKAGARGYLLKDATSETLVEAIRGVVQGESQLDPGIARRVLDEFQRLADQPSLSLAERLVEEEAEDGMLEPLTPREEEVLNLLVEGLPNREIGARLHLTEGTVKNYVSAIIAKLQANDRTHAVVTALRRGLVEL